MSHFKNLKENIKQSQLTVSPSQDVCPKHNQPQNELKVMLKRENFLDVNCKLTLNELKVVLFKGNCEDMNQIVYPSLNELKVILFRDDVKNLICER